MQLLSGGATRKLEAADAGLPSGSTGELARERVVLVDVPEGAVIGRVDVH